MRIVLLLTLLAIVGVAAVPAVEAHGATEECDKPACVECTTSAVVEILKSEPSHDCIWT